MKRVSHKIDIQQPGQLSEATMQIPFTGKICRAIITATMKGIKLYPIFYGTDIAGMGEADIVQLGSKIIPPGRFELTFSPVMQRFILAYPAAFGPLTAVFDPRGYEMLNAFDTRTETFTMPDGATVPYRLYESMDDTTQDGFTLKFIF